MLESECKKWASTLNAKSYFICQDQALKKIIISIYWLFQPDFYSLFWGEHWIQDVCQLFFINFMLQGNLLMGFISWKMWPIKSTIFVRPFTVKPIHFSARFFWEFLLVMKCVEIFDFERSVYPARIHWRVDYFAMLQLNVSIKQSLTIFVGNLKAVTCYFLSKNKVLQLPATTLL